VRFYQKIYFQTQHDLTLACKLKICSYDVILWWHCEGWYWVLFSPPKKCHVSTQIGHILCVWVFFYKQMVVLAAGEWSHWRCVLKKKGGAACDFEKHVGGGWYAWITNAGRLVDIRLFSMARGSRRPVPGSVGIILRHEEWLMLKKHAPIIARHHPVLATASPCYMDPTHLSDIYCTECHPY